jgi:DMSO/TMAO reductase YedYZ molybdopterin-dependent catalytic subunit
MSISRRNFLSLGVMAAGGQVLPELLWAEADPSAPPIRPFLTDPDPKKWNGPGRGKPPPHEFNKDELIRARLTPETWRLEIVGEDVEIGRPRKLDDGSAIDFPTLLELGKEHGVKFLKAMQCKTYAAPQGHGLWEGVPLREVLRLLVGDVSTSVRRVYWNCYHSSDPKAGQLFRTSLSYREVVDTPPGELPVFLAYRLNGAPLSMVRGGPVRILVPWAHGFKSVKWLQRIILTTSTNVNDTYHGDLDSHLKTMAWGLEGPATFKAGTPATFRGLALCGWPGLKRVEYWLRPDAGTGGKLDANDPAWKTATWQPCVIDPPPDDWSAHLPAGISPKEIWGFDLTTGKPKDWPLRYSIVTWTATLKDVPPGNYELRARTVDQNGFAQPEPRPQRESGINRIHPAKIIKVT